eukprot:6462758-Amphidinium_carterae.1
MMSACAIIAQHGSESGCVLLKDMNGMSEPILQQKDLEVEALKLQIEMRDNMIEEHSQLLASAPPWKEYGFGIEPWYYRYWEANATKTRWMAGQHLFVDIGSLGAEVVGVQPSSVRPDLPESRQPSHTRAAKPAAGAHLRAKSEGEVRCRAGCTRRWGKQNSML